MIVVAVAVAIALRLLRLQTIARKCGSCGYNWCCNVVANITTIAILRPNCGCEKLHLYRRGCYKILPMKSWTLQSHLANSCSQSQIENRFSPCDCCITSSWWPNSGDICRNLNELRQWEETLWFMVADTWFMQKNSHLVDFFWGLYNWGFCSSWKLQSRLTSTISRMYVHKYIRFRFFILYITS